MKLSECIEEVRLEKPNSFSAELQTNNINRLEASIQEFLGTDRDEWVQYEWAEDGGKELIVPMPYDVLYISYLKAKIDYALEEYESYANNQAQFESDFEEWKAWTIRSGMANADMPMCFSNWF